MERSPREPNSAAVGRRPGRGRRWHGESGLETIEYALIAAVILTALLASNPADRRRDLPGAQQHHRCDQQRTPWMISA